MAKTSENVGGKKGVKTKITCSCGGDMYWSKIMPGNRFSWCCQRCGKLVFTNGREKK